MLITFSGQIYLAEILHLTYITLPLSRFHLLCLKTQFCTTLDGVNLTLRNLSLAPPGSGITV